MAKANSNVVWNTIDLLTLPKPVLGAYDDYREAYAAMRKLRDAFETALAADIAPPKGKRVAVSYNFGKLSVAIVDDEAKPTSSKGSVSLASLRR